MKKILLFAIMTLNAFALKAQQEVEYTQFMYNKMALNPAYAGSRDITSFNMLGRYQWVGFTGAPKTLSLNVHSPIMNNKVAMGINLVYDQLGLHNHTYLDLAYAYRLQIKEKLRLSIGINGQVRRMGLNLSDAQSNDGLGIDNSLVTQNSAKMFLNAGAGLYLHHNNYYLGLSAQNLVPNKYEFGQANALVSKQYIHFAGMAGLALPLGKNLVIKPALLIKSVKNSPMQADINMGLMFKNALTIGATFRTGDSYAAMVAYEFGNGLRLGYAHDFTFTGLRKANDGSHEIMLGWDLGKVRESAGGYDNPRYF